ncbi:MAG: hypothetical protein LBK99_25500 [Opitutaceae bacterium]|jgi:ComF family protein|nr:hypothetical protein [Opitutaceae bacterium]
MGTVIGHLLCGLADVVFPPRCVACHGLVEPPATSAATGTGAAATAGLALSLHPRKERERGFNQSALLAGCFARTTGDEAAGVRIAPLLRRVLDTQTQTALSGQARRANLKNAFALAGGASINPGLHYILIDDVFTTGSTFDACARVLRRVGVVNLDVVTFGHG